MMRGEIKHYLKRVKRWSFADVKRIGYLINILQHIGKIVDDDLLDNAWKFLTAADKKRIIKRIIAGSRPNESEIDEHFEGQFSLTSYDRSLRKLLYAEHFCSLTRVFDRMKQQRRTFAEEKRFLELQNVFKISKKEIDLLLFLYLYATDGGTASIYDVLSNYYDQSKLRINSGVHTKLLAIPCGMRICDIQRLLSVDGKLRRTGILKSGEIELSDDSISFLEGHRRKPLTSLYFTEFTGTSLPLDAHLVPPADKQTVQAVLSSVTRREPVHVLLYGPPGTGKTAFARTLGRLLFEKVYEINNIEDKERRENDAVGFRQRGYAACCRVVENQNAMIIVDESDNLLNTQNGFFSFQPAAEKGQMNRLLDDSKIPTIWITNRHNGIDSSTCRRFDYSIPFSVPCREHRYRIWKTAVGNYGLTTKVPMELIEKLADNYEVNAGGIDVSLRNAARIKGNRSKTIQNTLTSILSAHQRLMNVNGTAAGPEKEAKNRAYALDGLNTAGN